MSGHLAFISHSSQDMTLAKDLAAALRERGIEVWIDDEQIAFGESVPRKIFEGLERASVVLVLITKAFVESRWCQAEYEAIIAKEIESGNTSVIPVLFDDTEVPTVFRAKRYVDFRKGLNPWELDSLAAAISSEISQTVAKRISDRSYHCSLLSMVIGGVIKDFPVATMTDAEIVKDRSLIDLYRTVDALITQFQNIAEVLVHESMPFASDYDATLLRLQDIEREMDTLVTSFEAILDKDSNLRTRLQDISRICVRIGGMDSGMYLSLGGRKRRPAPIEDVIHREGMNPAEDYGRLLGDLSAYRRELRAAIARVTSSTS